MFINPHKGSSVNGYRQTERRTNRYEDLEVGMFNQQQQKMSNATFIDHAFSTRSVNKIFDWNVRRKGAYVEKISISTSKSSIQNLKIIRKCSIFRFHLPRFQLSKYPDVQSRLIEVYLQHASTVFLKICNVSMFMPRLHFVNSIVFKCRVFLWQFKNFQGCSFVVKVSGSSEAAWALFSETNTF